MMFRHRFGSAFARAASVLVRAAVVLALFQAPGSAFAQAKGDPMKVDPISQRDLADIRDAFRGAGLKQADIATAADGRVTLVGEYENRDEVETAFSIARAVVGLSRVAPTTPTNIKYRLKGFDNAFAATMARMMQKKPGAAPAAGTVSPGSQALSQDTVAQAAPGPSQAPRAPRTVALVVGAGKNRYLPPQFALEGAAKDAQDFATFLQSREGGKLAPENIRVLINEQATSTALKAVFKEFADSAQPGDTVVLFVAAHGLPNAMNKFDIVLYDTEFPQKKVATKGQSLDFVITNRKTALADDDLQGWIAHLTTRDVRTVSVLDTCYSGKTFVSIPGFAPSRTRSLSQLGKEMTYTTSMPQEAITDLAQKAKDMKTSRIVIVSASENEESLESPEIGGGAFTQLYLKSLQKNRDYADAFDATKPSVIRFARTQGASQTPRMLVVPETAQTRM